MRLTAAELRALEDWLDGFATIDDARRAISAEIVVLETRDIFPVGGDEWLFVGPGGRIFRAREEQHNEFDFFRPS